MDFKEFSEKLLALEANSKAAHEDLKNYLQKLEYGTVYADKDGALEALGGCAWAWLDGCSMWGAAVVIIQIDQTDEGAELYVESLVENTSQWMGYSEFLDGLILNLHGDVVIDGKAWDSYAMKRALSKVETKPDVPQQQQVYDDNSIVSSSAEWKPWVL